jgi:hypothetical protein
VLTALTTLAVRLDERAVFIAEEAVCVVGELTV